jgi:hypothetical protein
LTVGVGSTKELLPVRGCKKLCSIPFSDEESVFETLERVQLLTLPLLFETALLLIVRVPERDPLVTWSSELRLCTASIEAPERVKGVVGADAAAASSASTGVNRKCGARSAGSSAKAARSPSDMVRGR